MAGLLGFGRDTLQAASNAIADGVGGPVDLINSGLLAVGLPMPAKPFGGSEWMRERGLTRKVADPYARALGETLGLVGPMVATAKAPQIAQGLLDHAEAYRRYHGATTAPGAPATVWHGTPHIFPPEPGAPLGRFRADKIGTGEGAQAYGHGHYTAGNKSVGRYYRDTLSSPNVEKASEQLFGGLDDVFRRDYSHVPDVDAQSVIQQLRLTPEHLGEGATADDLMQFARAIADKSKSLGTGSLYKVDLPDDVIAKMLNWDAGGQDAWKRAVLESGSPASAADLLRKQGIPGIRYLDGTSRNAGAGSSNYVVFPGEEGLLSILGRE